MRRQKDDYIELFLEELFDRPVDLVLADGMKPRFGKQFLMRLSMPRDFEFRLDVGRMRPIYGLPRRLLDQCF